MTEPIVNQYHPDFMYPPGETLKEILDERGLSEHDFAVRLGWTLKRLRAVLRGAAEITSPIAGQLEAELGVPAHFWLVHQKRYEEFVRRLPTQAKAGAPTLSQVGIH